MVPTLARFPEAFLPLLVVVGDRRETRPKTIGDLLAYSASTVDILYLNALRLPPDTPLVSDKVFVLEEESLLREKYATRNILTIGSPAANLFSRRINEHSLFRFKIDEQAKRDMLKQEAIVRDIARDQFGLSIYKGIVEGAQSVQDIVRLYRGRIEEDDRLAKRFASISQKYLESGLHNYRELLRQFEGTGILDPIRDGTLNLDSPQLKGAFLREWNDFGFVSVALHPFSPGGQFAVVYAAGRHGPATSHSIRWLAQKDVWDRRPYGGVFEVQMDTSKPFSTKFQEVNIVWDTDEYAVEFALTMLLKPKRRHVRVFVSSPLRRDDSKAKRKTERLATLLAEYHRERGDDTIIEHPYVLSFPDWNYVKGIIKHFPPADYIVHDITNYSPGVVFEVGCSIGLNKRFLLLWDTSVKAFPRKLPALLERIDIKQLDLKTKRHAKSTIAQALSSIGSTDESYQCPGYPGRDRGTPCPFRFNPEHVQSGSGEAFIVVNRKLAHLQKELIQRVRDHGFRAKLSKDFADEILLCRLCRGIATCQVIIVDVTEDDIDGLIALGMARSRERRCLQLFREGSRSCSMFDGLTHPWREETLGDDLASCLRQLLVVDEEER